jgi:hypothetical protein
MTANPPNRRIFSRGRDMATSARIFGSTPICSSRDCPASSFAFAIAVRHIGIRHGIAESRSFRRSRIRVRMNRLQSSHGVQPGPRLSGHSFTRVVISSSQIHNCHCFLGFAAGDGGRCGEKSPRGQKRGNFLCELTQPCMKYQCQQSMRANDHSLLRSIEMGQNQVPLHRSINYERDDRIFICDTANRFSNLRRNDCACS